jgi:hypothetical protein
MTYSMPIMDYLQMYLLSSGSGAPAQSDRPALRSGDLDHLLQCAHEG